MLWKNTERGISMEYSSYYTMSAEEVAKDYFKKLKVIRIIFYACLFGLYILIFIAIFRFKFLLLIALLLLVVISDLVFVYVKWFNFYRLNYILFTDCDPVKYIKVFDILEQADKHKKAVSTINLNKAYGYNLLKDYPALKNCLEKVSFKRSILSREILIVNLWGNYARNTNNMQMYKACIEKVNRFQNAKNRKAYKNSIAYLLNIWSMLDALEKEDRKTAKQLYHHIIKSENNNMKRVQDKYYLYKIEKLYQNEQEAKEALEYVIQYGNTMKIKEEAEAYMKEYNP